MHACLCVCLFLRGSHGADGLCQCVGICADAFGGVHKYVAVLKIQECV